MSPNRSEAGKLGKQKTFRCTSQIDSAGASDYWHGGNQTILSVQKEAPAWGVRGFTSVTHITSFAAVTTSPLQLLVGWAGWRLS